MIWGPDLLRVIKFQIRTWDYSHQILVFFYDYNYFYDTSHFFLCLYKEELCLNISPHLHMNVFKLCWDSLCTCCERLLANVLLHVSHLKTLSPLHTSSCFFICVSVLNDCGQCEHEKGAGPRCTLFTWYVKPSLLAYDLSQLGHFCFFSEVPSWAAMWTLKYLLAKFFPQYGHISVWCLFSLCSFSSLSLSKQREHILQVMTDFSCWRRLCLLTERWNLNCFPHVSHDNNFVACSTGSEFVVLFLISDKVSSDFKSSRGPSCASTVWSRSSVWSVRG